ncbi:MAG: outer membrane lipoprotein carrier protein LolA [Deltaproteobacteria bacterium]|nr:outer membrane lipoprotein carrier protein LolA [Deltaproteobacteria bacterium]MBI4197087.1 outer membrane lipoprotein carrier protein LolA [Deltaproteobacteria bacterium]
MSIFKGTLCFSVLLILFSAQGLANDLVARVEKAYQETAVLRAEFVQRTYVELLEKEVVEEGALLLAKPGRFAIHYHGKRERKYLSDGRRLWIVYPGEKEIETIANVREAVSQEALAFLSGLAEMNREFDVSVKKDTGVSKRLELRPRSERSPFKKIILVIDPESYLAREIYLYPRSGNQSHYLLKRLKTGDSVTDQSFRP